MNKKREIGSVLIGKVLVRVFVFVFVLVRIFSKILKFSLLK